MVLATLAYVRLPFAWSFSHSIISLSYLTGLLRYILEWFSKRTGTSFENGARSKNAEKKLGRERRRVVLKSDLARETCSKFLFYLEYQLTFGKILDVNC